MVTKNAKDRLRNFVNRGASRETFQRLFDSAMTMPLADEVGVLYVEIAQPVEASVALAANLSVGVLRHPRAQIEYADETGRIASFIRENGRTGRDTMLLRLWSSCRPWLSRLVRLLPVGQE